MLVDKYFVMELLRDRAIIGLTVETKKSYREFPVFYEFIGIDDNGEVEYLLTNENEQLFNYNMVYPPDDFIDEMEEEEFEYIRLIGYKEQEPDWSV